MYFQRGLKLGDTLTYTVTRLRAVYFQRGLKPGAFPTLTPGGLRAVYFQRGLKPMQCSIHLRRV